MHPLANSLRDDPDLPAALLGDDPLAAALALARLGIGVFPAHTVDAEGGCSCGTQGCPNAGKHPRTMHGLLDVTVDPRVILDWWRRWSGASPAVVTGADSGVWVLDVDPDKGGEDAVAALEAEHGEVPPTWAVETGGGGLHLYFHHPGGPVPTSAGKLGPGLDVRGDGGYAIVPPARHRSGGRYAWGASWRPGLVPLAAAPPWLLALARKGQGMVPPVPGSIGDRDGRNHFAVPIPEGGRNDALARLAGAMRRRGSSESAIRAALLAEGLGWPSRPCRTC